MALGRICTLWGLPCYRLITDKAPLDAFECLEEDELIMLSERDDQKHRFSVEFLSTIGKSLYYVAT